MMKEKLLSNRVDYSIIIIYIVLIIIGWMMVYAVNYDANLHPSPFDTTVNAGRQFIWLLISLVIVGGCIIVPVEFWRSFSPIFYLTGLILLVGVLFFGKVINGARAWYSLGFFSFQPVEFMKFATALTVSSFLSAPGSKITESKIFFSVIAIFLFPIILVILQPDAGSCLVFFSFFLLLYRLGLSAIYYHIAFLILGGFVISLYFGIKDTAVILSILALIFLIYFTKNNILVWLIPFILSIYFVFFNFQEYYWYYISLILALIILFSILNYRERNFSNLTLILIVFGTLNCISLGANIIFEYLLKPHQKERINVWLHPEKCDPQGSLYNVLQSKMAIGSGGFWGKGFLEGTMTKLNYVPEQSTDFIFCTVGEEFGFFGVLIVLLIYTILIVKIIQLSELQKLNFNRNYGYCLAGILFVHIFINISMTIGLMPIIGIPLPFLSHGGSSMTGFSLLIGVFIKMELTRQQR